MSIFDVAMFSDVFYEINKKYYGKFNATLSTQLIEAFSSVKPKHYIALHVKCPCLWTDHRLDSFIEKKCTIPDMNSHKICAVGVKIQPKVPLFVYRSQPKLSRLKGIGLEYQI
jgi:hypothetical protein